MATPEAWMGWGNWSVESSTWQSPPSSVRTPGLAQGGKIKGTDILTVWGDVLVSLVMFQTAGAKEASNFGTTGASAKEARAPHACRRRRAASRPPAGRPVAAGRALETASALFVCCLLDSEESFWSGWRMGVFKHVRWGPNNCP